jgi:hypothetical protein
MWSINSFDIFVDYCCSNELFIDSCFLIQNVYQFHVFSPPKCNLNLFGHFFYPYISLNLDEYDIPLNSCFSINSFMHLSIINVISFASDFIFYPTFVNVSFFI